MPYNIYDKRGNKIGEVRRPEDEAAAVILTIILMIFLIPVFLAIVGIIGFIEYFWTWARSFIMISPYPSNINAIATTITIFIAAFILTARWEQILRGDVSLVDELKRVLAVYLGTILSICMGLWFYEADKFPDNVVFSEDVFLALFIGAPVVVNSLWYLRFRLIQAIVGLAITLIIIVILIVLAVNWVPVAIDQIVKWLLR